MDKHQKQTKQENKNILSAYIGVAGPETPKYLAANNFLTDFFQTASDGKLMEINYRSFKEAGIIACEEDDEQKKRQLEASFDRFFKRFSGLDTNYENETFYFPLRPQMLRRSKANLLRHLHYNMLPDIERKVNFQNLQNDIQKYLYEEATGVNYLLNVMCETLFHGGDQKNPVTKNQEFSAQLKKKQYRKVCENFKEDLECLLTHPYFRKLDFYKKYDYLATLLNHYVIQFIVKKSVNSRGKGGNILCQGAASSHLLSGGAFHRACVQNYAKLREVFPKEQKEFYLNQMELETGETREIYVWKEGSTLYVDKNLEETGRNDEDKTFLNFVNRVFNSNYRKASEKPLYESMEKAFRLTEEDTKYSFSIEEFVTLYMNVSQARKGSALTKISSTLPTCGKDIGFVFPNSRSRHKYFALSPSLLEFYVRLYLARKDRTYAYLDTFLADLEERYGICIQKSEKMDQILKELGIKVPFQEFRKNEQALLDNLDENNCLVRLSDSGYVVTLPEEKGEFRLL